MKKKESQGFFCVVYFADTKKTAYFHKVWNPSKLANFYANKWLWIKIYIDKNDYYSDRQAQNYYKIFDKNTGVEIFTFQPFSKNTI